MKKELIRYLPLAVVSLATFVILPLLRCNPYSDNPLHRPVQLAAGFGEIRPDHFHMGADMRTDGREGLPVYAVKEGYISHVSIQSSGYGKALSVTHPDGTTTLYAHLSLFTGPAAAWISETQYSRKSWQQELDAAPGEFTVKKGQCIGYSGNTGNTQGPHLHFEVRNTTSGRSMNPLDNGIRMTDTVKPVLKALYWYNRCVSVYEDTAHEISTNTIHTFSPFIGIGISSFDRFTEGRFTTGIDKAQVYKDNILQYSFSIRQLSMAETRYVNSCIDYGKALATGRLVQLLFTLPGNKLPYTRLSPSGGVIDLSDRKLHIIKVVVSDLAGNEAERSCYMQYNGTKPCLSPNGKIRLVYPGRDATFNSAHAVVTLPCQTFYDAIPLQIRETNSNEPDAVSVAVNMLMPVAPVHTAFTAGIVTTLKAGDPLRKHVVMVMNEKKGKSVVKGIWNKNTMTGTFTSVGSIQLVADKTPPTVKRQTGHKEEWVFTCQDNLGEIASFSAEADGHWLAFEQKDNTWRYQRDEHMPRRAKKITVTVTDIAGNVTVNSYPL